MPEYSYIICDEEGKKIKGSIIADSEAEVVAQIRKDDITIISIEEVKAVQAAPAPVMASEKTAADNPVKSASKFELFGSPAIKTKDIVVFSRQFATLIDAGVPISQSLDALIAQTINPSLHKILEGISLEIKEGNSLSASFAMYPKVFDNLYVNMLRVGEAGGILNQVLERTAAYLEKSEKFKQKIQSAMVYPVVIMGIAFTITGGLIIFVVPTFAHIYDSLNQKLPAMTQMLIDLSNVMKKYFLVFIAFTIGLVVLIKRYQKTPKGGLLIDRLMLKLPIFGDMICKSTVSRFCHTFATLSQSGVPILEALDVVKQSSGNRVIEILAEDLKASIREGEGLAVTLEKSPVFPTMVTRMISIGEQSGQLDKMMTKVAEFYDEEMDATMDGLTKIIEPLIIGFLGIIIGFIVVALFLPILNMATAMH